MPINILIGILEAIISSPGVQDEVRKIIEDALEKLNTELSKQHPH